MNQKSPEESYDPKLSLQELSRSISSLGIKKANNRVWQLFLLGLLAGLYISIGGHLFLIALEQGMGKVLAGAFFSVGLVLVVIAGAELFTGNVIMIVGALSTLYPVRKVLKNWVVVYLANLIGSLLYAILVFRAGLFPEGAAITELAAAVAEKKLALTFSEAFIRGFFCNILVLLAIIMSVMARDIISKIFTCLLPVMAFVAIGFEHCVANMFLIPIGLLAGGIPLAEHYVIFGNILPVTLGNIAGGLFILLIHPNRIRQLKVLLTMKK